MLKDEQIMDLEKLKMDPRMWMRLATPLDDSNVLGNVFQDKENPFEKNSKAAMETVQKLASEGKLYMREKGRSRHFREVKMDGEALKLGDQHEMKLANRSSDPVLGALMWMSRGYFKWLGLEKVSNWFDERLKRRDAIKEMDNQYKEEYKSLTEEEKKELKALRKHEKNLKKLEKVKKEAEKTQQELDKIRGVDTKTKGEMDAPLNQAPEIEPEKNTMQPTRMGDEPVREQKTVQPTRTNNLVQERTAEQEIIGEKKEKAAGNENSTKINLNGVEYTKENINELPEIVREALQMIQQFIEQQKAIERGTRQRNQEQLEVKKTEQQPEKFAENIQPVTNENRQEEMPAATGEEIRPTVNAEAFEKEMPAPLNDPPKLEDKKVDIQGRPKEQEQPTLQERLAAEKEAMDSAINWKDRVANSLFSHEEGSTAREYYQMISNGNEAAGAEFLSGAVFGILASNSGGPEQKQQVMDALLSGKPLGSENANLIDNGVAAYNDAIARKTNGNPNRLSDMLAESIRELSHQASREATLSPRLVMLGRLLSNAAQIANENGLELPMDEDELSVARGAATLAEVAQKYHNARQFLGNEPMDMKSLDGRKAVRDLLMGNAVEKMIQQDINMGQTITNTQQIMGEGLWTLKNLQLFTSDTTTRRGIQPEDIQVLLERPNSTKALGIGKNTVNEIVQASMEVYTEAEQAMQKEMELGQQENQLEINPLIMPG